MVSWASFCKCGILRTNCEFHSKKNRLKKRQSMIKINEYWYTQQEVETALRKKGYTVVTLEMSAHARDYPQHETYALKNDENPGALNKLQAVALKEFHKKPPLM